MTTILLASDLQHGRPHRAGAAEALLRLAENVEPDVIVVAGDLTQRAKVREYMAARAFLDRLPDVPVVVTPGNHDVPLYRVWERLLAPYRNWRRFVAGELDSVTRAEGVTLVALNSSAPRRAIVGGRLGQEQIDFARDAFGSAPEDDVRVLVVHHHFVAEADGEGGAPLPGASRWLAAFESMGVDVILGGHLHQCRIASSSDVLASEAGAGGIPLVACGTSTSTRGRGPERDRNSAAVVRVSGDQVDVEPFFLEPGTDRFESGTRVRLLRPRRSRPGGTVAEQSA